MRISIRDLLMMFILVIGASGCSDKGDGGPVAPQTLKWNIDGTEHTAETISFIQLSGYNYIYATKGTTDVFLATTSTLVGSYSLPAANAAMGLTISGTQYTNLSCEITITSNSNAKLKGNFSGTFAIINVDTVSVTGIFEDVAY
jgi:hypothetical protein